MSCYFCVCVALSLELVLPAQFTLELATQQTQACKCYQMYFINGFFCFFQNLKLKASTTPNIYIYIYKHWQNGVKGEGYHSHKQHVHILAWRSERSPLVVDYFEEDTDVDCLT